MPDGFRRVGIKASVRSPRKPAGTVVRAKLERLGSRNAGHHPAVSKNAGK